MKKILSLLLIVILSFTLISCESAEEPIKEEVIKENVEQTPEKYVEERKTIDKNGYFTSKEDVSLYIHTHRKLPKNFITKKEAIKLGWESNKGNLWDVTDKKSIGGDRFGNREGKLPNKLDRNYFECDINYTGGFRGPERIVYSDDGLIYYTEDHYDNFKLLYGDE